MKRHLYHDSVIAAITSADYATPSYDFGASGYSAAEYASLIEPTITAGENFSIPDGKIADLLITAANYDAIKQSDVYGFDPTSDSLRVYIDADAASDKPHLNVDAFKAYDTADGTKITVGDTDGHSHDVALLHGVHGVSTSNLSDFLMI